MQLWDNFCHSASDPNAVICSCLIKRAITRDSELDKDCSMAFEPNGRGDYVDPEREITAKRIRGGPDGRTGWRISAAQWSFEFNVREQFPPERDAIKVESLDFEKQYPGDKDEAKGLVWDLLDALRRQPFMMKGRAGPKPIII